MATYRSSKSKSKRGRKTARRTSVRLSPDAVVLLKADHREVSDWFAQFESSRSSRRKQELAGKICKALTVHTQIEEEIFYPAFLAATRDKDMHHEAAVEHDGAKKLIAQIEASGPNDDYYDAKVKVLSEMIRHHVNEEEQRGGMFAKARRSSMDLKALGGQLKARKDELMAGAGGAPRGRRGTLGRLFNGSRRPAAAVTGIR